MAQKDTVNQRPLTPGEISSLLQNGNRAESWERIRVEIPFDPDKVLGNTFLGDIVLGSCTLDSLHGGEIHLPTGVYNSVISTASIGTNCAIHNVKLLSNYTIGRNVLLFNIDEMTLSEAPVFGTGIESDRGIRRWISVANENGGRKVLPFRSMMTADCYLWSKYREEKQLMEKLVAFTDEEEQFSERSRGSIGNHTVIRSCRIIRDIRTGEYAHISGADVLKNLTISSSKHSPARIGEGVELINGIIGGGAQVLYDVKAFNFVISSHSTVKSGARFFDSFLGENATVACCEVQSALIFPFHEQHHNNSFLIASTLQGQSNIAAGATIGSNHNSRGADGEIFAERGFWPALSSSLKHNCTFAAFILLAKSDYPHELHIEIPFSLVSQDASSNRLLVMPAYWFLYNMYALARNSWKFSVRDRRTDTSQYIEFDYLAPDTVEEMFQSLELLKLWTGRAWYRKYRSFTDYVNTEALMEKGEEILTSSEGEIASLEVLGEGMENSTRDVLILKAEKAFKIYREMIHYYAVKNIVTYAADHQLSLVKLSEIFAGAARTSWINLGGQLIRKGDLDRLKTGILTSQINSWKDVHREYITLSKTYREHKCRHAYASLISLYSIQAERDMTPAFWLEALDKALSIQQLIERNTYESRLKDYTNKYRRITFDTMEEMEAVIGTIEDNNFISIIHKEAEAFEAAVEKVKKLTNFKKLLTP